MKKEKLDELFKKNMISEEEYKHLVKLLPSKSH